MKNESDISSKERGEKNTKIKEMADRIKELQRLEKNRKDTEKRIQTNIQITER